MLSPRALRDPRVAAVALAAIEFDEESQTLFALRSFVDQIGTTRANWRKHALRFPEPRIRKVVFDATWPGFTLHFDGFAGNPEEYVFRPGSVVLTKPRQPWTQLAQMLDRFGEVVRTRGWTHDQGWLQHPVVNFEPAKMPERVADVPQTAYRSAAVGPRVIWRERPGSIERLMAWVASRGDWRWPEPPQTVALTDDAVIADFGRGVTLAAPRHGLRDVVRLGDDAVYLFGRYAGLTFYRRQTPCPVREALDAQLARGVG